MAVANRYTKYNPAVFSPMSLQDLMVVPLAQQKKHDEQVAAQDLMSQQASSLIGLPGQDSELISKKIKDYQTKIQEQAEKISSEGVTREGGRAFKDFYKQFQADTSPTGEVGRITTNYAGAKQKEAAFRQNMAKMGHTPEYINKKIAEQYGTFKGTVGENGTYNEFGEFVGSNFYDPKKETMELMSRAGASGVRVGSVGADVEYDPTMGIFKVNKTLTGIEQSNANNIKDGINAILAEYESGDKRKFLDDYGITQDQFKERVTNTAGVFKKSMDANPLETTSIMNAPKPKDPKAQTGSNKVFNKYVSAEKIPVPGIKSPANAGEALVNSVASKSSLYYRDNGEYGFGSTSLGQPRTNKPGVSEVNPSALEKMMVEGTPKRLEGGAAGVEYTDSRGKKINIMSTDEGLVIEGGGYSSIIQDKGIERMFDTYFSVGASKTREDYKKDTNTRKSNMSQLRVGTLSNMSDELINNAYAKAVGEHTNTFGSALNFTNNESSYYKEDERILGKKGDFGLGNIKGRKVTAIDSDGNFIPDFRNINDLAKRLTDKEFSDMDNTEKQHFFDQIHSANSYGVDTSDSELKNPRQYGLTDFDGNFITLKVESGSALSSNSAYQGMDDAHEMQQYLVKGQPFVNKGRQRIRDGNGNTFDNYQYFIHYPMDNGDGTMSITPLLVSTDTPKNNLEGVMSLLDMSTLQAKDTSHTHVEGIQDVTQRVEYNIDRYYRNTVQGKTTFSQRANETTNE